MSEPRTPEPSKDSVICHSHSYSPIDASEDWNFDESWSNVHSTLQPILLAPRDPTSPESLDNMAEYQATNNYYQPDPPFATPLGQDLESEAGTSTLEDLHDFLSSHIPQTYSDPPYFREVQNIPPYWTDGPQHAPAPFLPQFSGGGSPDRLFQAQSGPSRDELHHVDQHPPPEPSNNPEAHDEIQWTVDFQYPVASEPEALVDHALETPAFVDAGVDAGETLPPQVGVEGKQKTMQEPAESSSAETNSAGVQNPNKRGRGATPDLPEGGKEPKKRRKNPRKTKDRLYRIPANPSVPLPTRPDLLALEQTRYECDIAQKEWKRLPPISFTVEKGMEGIDLVSAINGKCSDFDDRDEPMLEGGSISLRLEIVGRQPVVGKKVKQIHATNYRKSNDPITRQKLAEHVAKTIQSYLNVKEGEIPFHIPLENIFLVRLHHVSLSSWQPELWYKNPASTSS